MDCKGELMLLRIDNALIINTEKIICIDINYSIISESWTDNYQPLEINFITIKLENNRIYGFEFNKALRVLGLLGIDCTYNLVD